MAIHISETFRVDAPIDPVFAFLTSARTVASCLPGAQLLESSTDTTFVGRVNVKIGALTVVYEGRAVVDECDAAAHRVRLVVTGHEAGGNGSVAATLASELTAVDAGTTEVRVTGDADVVGTIAGLGRGLTEEVARQMVRQFAVCLQRALATPAAAGPRVPQMAAPAGLAPAPLVIERRKAPREVEPVRLVPRVLNAVNATLRRVFHRGRPPRR